MFVVTLLPPLLTLLFPFNQNMYRYQVTWHVTYSYTSTCLSVFTYLFTMFKFISLFYVFICIHYMRMLKQYGD
jgi:hypothetical protein